LTLLQSHRTTLDDKVITLSSNEGQIIRYGIELGLQHFGTIVRASPTFNCTQLGSPPQSYYTHQLSECILRNIAVGPGYLAHPKYVSYSIFYDLVIKQELVTWNDPNNSPTLGSKRKNNPSLDASSSSKRQYSSPRQPSSQHSNENKPSMVQGHCLFAILENLKVRRSGESNKDIFICQHKTKHVVDRATIKSIGHEAISQALHKMKIATNASTQTYIKKQISDLQ
jgi:hypothetical protein